MTRMAMVAVVLTYCTAVSANDENPDPRTTVTRYVAAALAGRVDDAVRLAVAGQRPSRKENIEGFRVAVDTDVVPVPTVWADEKKGEAIAVTKEVKLTIAQNGQNEGRLVFALVRLGGKWLVKDIKFSIEPVANAQVIHFRENHPGSKEYPVETEKQGTGSDGERG